MIDTPARPAPDVDGVVERLRGSRPTRQMHGVFGAEGSTFDHVADQQLREEAANALQSEHRARIEAEAERDKLNAAMAKISAIRDSIIGYQTVGWSEHIYPLVAALHDGGFEGVGYEKARENVSTVLNALTAAEAKVAELTRQRDEQASFASHWHGEIETIGVLLGIGGPDAGEVPVAVRTRLDELTRQRDEVMAALTPSAETKAAYMGEFSVPLPDIDEDGNEVMRRINVPWTTIKEIMAAIRARSILTPDTAGKDTA